MSNEVQTLMHFSYLWKPKLLTKTVLLERLKAYVKMTFISLLNTAFTSILNGIIITAAIMAILYFILKSLSRNMVRTPIFFITGIVMALLLVVQISLMIGAIQAKGATDSAQIYLTQMLESSSGTVNAQDSQIVMDKLVESYPIIGVYLNQADFSGHDVSELAESMYETMNSYLGSYIWHRVWWSLGIIIVGCLIVMMYDKRDTVSGKPKQKKSLAARKNYDDF